jgi:hypothetical protein
LAHLLRSFFAAVLVLSAATVLAVAPTDAIRLSAKRTELLPQLQAQTFGEPLHLVSNETNGRMSADVYADMALPFARVATVLGSAESVCGVLFLHLNVRSCQPSHGTQGDVVMLSAGPKQGATAGTVYSMAYTMRVEASTADYLRVSLVAATGRCPHLTTVSVQPRRWKGGARFCTLPTVTTLAAWPEWPWVCTWRLPGAPRSDLPWLARVVMGFPNMFRASAGRWSAM